MPYPIPFWLQLAIGVFDILAPELAWLNPVIEALYEIFRALPWFHKAGFLVEWKQSVTAAKLKHDTKPLEEMKTRWAAHVGVPSDLIKE